MSDQHQLPPLVRQIAMIQYDDHPQYQRVPIHMHPFCKLEVVLAGNVVLISDDYKPVVLKKGDAALIPPLTPHGYEPRKRLHHVAIKFHIHSRYRFMMKRNVICMSLPSHILSTARRCGELSLDEEPLNRVEAQAGATYCTTHAVGTALSTQSGEFSNNEMTGMFAEVINEVTRRPIDAWSVSDLAASCFLSESQFTKRFTRAFGQSPQQFLLDTRMIAAADMLVGTQWSIKRIAEKTGYANVHSFSRAFARVIGSPPATFRKSQPSRDT